MNSDLKLFRWLALVILLPIALAIFSGERYRYPCQNPENWETAQCQKPLCDVTRTCPEHVFKGQRDPRLGPPSDQITQTPTKPVCEAKCDGK